jgi:hypothetical protein
MTVFPPKGSAPRTAPFNLSDGKRARNLLAIFTGGAIVFTSILEAVEPRPNVMQSGCDVVIVNPGKGQSVVWSGISGETYREPIVSGADRGTFIMHLPFGRTFVSAGDTTVLYFGNATSYELRALSSTGKVRMMIRVAIPPRRVTSDMIRVMDSTLRGPQGRPTTWGDKPIPKVVPAYENLLIDPDHRLWVQEYRAPGDARITWRIFSPDGRLAGSLVVPGSVRIRGVARGMVVTTRMSEDGAEEIVTYRYR